jgi:hypothetical protein
MDKSDYSTLEKSRRAAILTAANLLEAADKAKRLRKRFASTLTAKDDGETAPTDRGDFLFDLLRLNANYLNQLATLGKRHGGIAQSALEKLYGLMVPANSREASSELSFTRSRRTARFLVRNDASPESKRAEISSRSFVPSDDRADGSWLSNIKAMSGPAVVQETSGGSRPVKTYLVNAPLGHTVELVAQIYDEFAGQRQYSAELVVKLGRVQRTIPVSIDWRKGSR